MNIRPALLVIDENRVLTMRYRYGNADVYNLAGGNVEFGESMQETLLREMQEELGIEVEVQDLVLVGEVHLGNKQTLHCVFRGKILYGTPTLNPAETSALEICWIDLENLSQINLYPNIAAHLLKPPENQYVGKIEQIWHT